MEIFYCHFLKVRGGEFSVFLLNTVDEICFETLYLHFLGRETLNVIIG